MKVISKTAMGAIAVLAVCNAQMPQRLTCREVPSYNPALCMVAGHQYSGDCAYVYSTGGCYDCTQHSGGDENANEETCKQKKQLGRPLCVWLRRGQECRANFLVDTAGNQIPNPVYSDLCAFWTAQECSGKTNPDGRVCQAVSGNNVKMPSGWASSASNNFVCSAAAGYFTKQTVACQCANGNATAYGCTATTTTHRCKSCNAGYWLDNSLPPSSSCKPCGKGTYSKNATSIAGDTCAMCPQNTYQDQSAAKDCKPCGLNKKSRPGSTSQDACA